MNSAEKKQTLAASSPEDPPGHAASPLLGALLDHLPEVFHTHVLTRLDDHDLAMLGRACSASRKAVKSSGMSRAGTSKAVPLLNEQFFGSVERATWARDNGCPWELGDVHNCYYAATAGSLEVLKWLREQNFAWNWLTCYAACGNGHPGESGKIHPKEGGCAGARHLELLQWARMNGCPWDEKRSRRRNGSEMYATAGAAQSGNIEMLRWVISQGLGWHPNTFAIAADHANLETLVWLRENGAPWNWRTTAWAARRGHLEMLVWLRENGAPWGWETTAWAAARGHLVG
jgi:hypothetical protein